jgi:hypothetical protein
MKGGRKGGREGGREGGRREYVQAVGVKKRKRLKTGNTFI